MQVRAGKAGSISPGGRATVTTPHQRVVLFNVAGQLYAIDASCGHRGGPLDAGVLKDGIITCPWHLHRYDVATGERIDLEGVHQAVFPVSIQNGDMYVELPDPEPERSIRDLLLDHAREWERDT